MLEFMSGWLTPTSFFLLLNIVVGTIWLTSLFGSPKQPLHLDYSSSPSRASSLLDRLNSINSDTPHHSSPPEPRFSRAPSLLDRVKSVHINDFHFSLFTSQPQIPEPEIPDPAEIQRDENPVQLARPPSLLQRVKSIKFPELQQLSAFRSEVYGHVERTKSEGLLPARRVAEMSKSASERMVVEETEVVEKRRPATARVERTTSIGDVEVDAKADDFINRFKQQLKLQRLDSLIRYKDMITRGASR